MGFINWFMGYALVWVFLALCGAFLCALSYLAYYLFEEWSDDE